MRKEIARKGTIFRRKSLRGSLAILTGVLVAFLFLLSGCISWKQRTSRPYKTKYNTIAHLILDVELDHTSKEDAPQNYAMLDWIIDSALDEVDSVSTGQKSEKEYALKVLERIAFMLEVYGFEYEGKQLLSVGLRSKKINCDGYSAIYLAVGEVLGLPIKMVRAPAHTFVRWHLDDDEYINWETTRGVEKSDSYYIIGHDIALKDVGVGSMRSLDVDDDRSKILANAYVNSGVEWLGKCMPTLAVARFLEAIERDPTYDTPYYNIGLVHFKNGNNEQAIKWCRKALKKNENHLRSHAILKEAYSTLNRHGRSQEHFAKVIELDPDHYLKVSLVGKQRASVCKEEPFFLSFFDRL